MAESILYIDDLEANRRLVTLQLQQENYQIITAGDCEEGLDLIKSNAPALILLDIMMPKIDGWEALSYIRQITKVPVIILSSLDKRRVMDRLNEIIDDYAHTGVIDFVERGQNQELLLRIKKHLIESNSSDAPQQIDSLYDDGYLTVDLTDQKTTVNGVEGKLSARSYLILRELFKAYPHPVDGQELINAIWPEESMQNHDPTRKLRLAIMRLRQYIEPDPQSPTYWRSFI
ncbi:MAG: response regulator transcription factor [Chloroflexota bacterium]